MTDFIISSRHNKKNIQMSFKKYYRFARSIIVIGERLVYVLAKVSVHNIFYRFMWLIIVKLPGKNPKRSTYIILDLGFYRVFKLMESN